MTAGVDSPPQPDDWRRARAIVLGGAIIRLLFAGLIPVFPDEAYYWDWSRHLSAGYFDHPPGVALLIRLGGTLFSPTGASATSLAVRIGPVLAGLVAAFATIAIARRLAGDAAALRAALVVTCMPLAAAGLILATPDAPLLAMTALGLYSLTRVLESTPRTRASLRWWIATGLALGLAFDSKYTSILLPAGVVIAIVARGDLRLRLREPGPYVACIVATLVFAPVLIWNARHAWISFTYQLHHGLSAPTQSIVTAALKREGDYVGGQAALASPILWILMAIAVARSVRRGASGMRFAFAMVALLAFGLFAFSALRQRVEPNWPAPAYIPAIVLLATESWGPRAGRWLKWGVGLAAAMSLTIYVQGVVPILPVPARKDPIARAFGWRQLADRVGVTMRTTTAATGAPSWAGGDRYQEAAEMALHEETHAPTFAVNLSGRPNQYDLWPGFPDRARVGDNLVLAVDDADAPHPAVVALAPYFGGVRQGERVVLRRGEGEGEVGVRRLWVLIGWKGGWPLRVSPLTASPQRVQ